MSIRNFPSALGATEIRRHQKSPSSAANLRRKLAVMLTQRIQLSVPRKLLSWCNAICDFRERDEIASSSFAPLSGARDERSVWTVVVYPLFPIIFSTNVKSTRDAREHLLRAPISDDATTSVVLCSERAVVKCMLLLLLLQTHHRQKTHFEAKTAKGNPGHREYLS